MSKYLLLSILLFCMQAQAENLAIGDFANNGLKHWETQQFEGKTHYQLRQEDGRTTLHALANSSASGLVLKQKIDLRKTPYLHWQWKVSKTAPNYAENKKSGDDFSARIYVVISGGVFFWQTRALNYVWASKADKNSLWDNPFTSQAKMLALRNEDDSHDQWQQETRDVRVDLKRAFADEITHIDAIAIMTDSDNSKTVKSATYADIWFSSSPEAPATAKP
jgi:hypothetical protein